MSDESATLVPIEEKEVDFYGDTIVAVLIDIEEGEQPEIYVPVRPIVEYLGLAWSGQYERIQRDPVLLESIKGVRVTRTPSDSGVGGGPQEMLCLPIEMLHGYLFGISVNRVKKDLREKIIQYKKSCYKALWEAFKDDAMRALGGQPARESTALYAIREMGLAVAQLAEEQLQLEGRVSDLEDLAQGAHERLDTAAKVIGNMMRRQDYLEARIAPGKPITEQQAAEISATVKALAQLLTEQDASQNYYQGIFAELYRRFGVSSYKNIPVSKFKEVVQFLEDWRQSAAGEEEDEEN